MSPSAPPTSVRPAGPRRAPFIVRVFTSPVSAGAVERRINRMLQPAVRAALTIAPFAFGLLLVVLALELWLQRTPTLRPRHRAEALCFALAQSPRFAPPMRVDPSSAMVRDRFPLATPPAMGLRMTMHYDDRQVIDESTRRVGDFEVAVVWLRVPEPDATRHWLVLGWMEGADLATCSFRFASTAFDLSSDEKVWGDRLLDRILHPDYFRAGVTPDVRLRVARGESLPHFGPRTPS